MGRHKEIKTKRQKLIKEKKMREKHNLHRRKKYATDEKYRERVAVKSKNRYRSVQKLTLRMAVPIDEVSSFATKREVVFEKKDSRLMLCLTYEEMAKCLGDYHKFVIHRWVRAKKFPAAPHIAKENSFPKNVYLVEEAKRIVGIMRIHQKEKAYLTHRDSETVAKLFAAMN